MDKIAFILKEHFSVDPIDITEIHGGLSTMNYKVVAHGDTFFLKVYHKKKAQASIWTENISCYMPILVWLNENTKLQGKIVRPIKTNRGDFSFEDSDHVFLLFDYIEGHAAGKSLTHSQLLEAAEIMACLHSHGRDAPAVTHSIQEDFSVPFCISLEHFLSEQLSAVPAHVKAILEPCLTKLLGRNNEVKALARQMKGKQIKPVLCHTDAHGYNLMESRSLVLVDWEGIKLAPAEADLIMFSKAAYWDIFMGHYLKKRPHFVLDKDIFMFYILRRKIEDIWAFIQGILFDDLSTEERVRDLAHLSNCCNALDDLYFEL